MAAPSATSSMKKRRLDSRVKNDFVIIRKRIKVALNAWYFLWQNIFSDTQSVCSLKTHIHHVSTYKKLMVNISMQIPTFCHASDCSKNLQNGFLSWMNVNFKYFILLHPTHPNGGSIFTHLFPREKEEVPLLL